VRDDNEDNKRERHTDTHKQRTTRGFLKIVKLHGCGD
jgi:hypothetical protein